MIPDVSIVIPCYRAAHIAARSVSELRAFFSRAPIDSWEIIVVDDGGADFSDDDGWDSQTRLVRLSRNHGKGAAVAAGMAAALGRIRIYTDVDLPYGTDQILLMIEYLRRRNFHLVVGDRTLPTSEYHASLGLQRRLASRLSAAFVGRVVTGGFFDTQCGLKALRGDVADLVFPMIRTQRFAFDVELVYIALLHRLDIKRIPVQLRSNETSSVRVLRDSFQGTIDVMKIKQNQLRGMYESSALRHLVEADITKVKNSIALNSQIASPIDASIGSLPAPEGSSYVSPR